MSDGSGVDLETVSVRQGYARWSETYDTQDNFLIILEEPLLRSLLGDVQELSVADIGCGRLVHGNVTHNIVLCVMKRYKGANNPQDNRHFRTSKSVDKQIYSTLSKLIAVFCKHGQTTCLC